jgi:hypothetical protein
MITLAAALSGAACEDGPSQTFTLAPPGAGSIWNGPGAGAAAPDSGLFVAPATRSFDASTGGSNANDLCTATQKKTVWTANFSMPIFPQGLAGGLDIIGGQHNDGLADYQPTCLSYDSCTVPATPPTYAYSPAIQAAESWNGATVEQAEKLLCQAAAGAVFSGNDNNEACWGEQNEFCIQFDLSSRLIQYLLLQTGYAGSITATNATTQTTYNITLNNVYMTKTVGSGAAQNVILDWTGDVNATVVDMWEAFRQTFLPTFPAEPNCMATGHCFTWNFQSGGGGFGFTPLNILFYVTNTVSTPAAGSIPTLIQVGTLKVLPFTPGQVLMKLDPQGEGPVVFAPGLGDSSAPRTCTYVLGMPYGDPSTAGTFEHDCVQVWAPGDENNTLMQNKLIGGMAHGDETYSFNVQGIDPQFSATLPATQVIHDGELPSAGDKAYQIGLDQSLIAPVANDYTNNDSTQPRDWHGFGMVQLEWVYLIQQYMQAHFGVTANLGDPDCIANPVRPSSADGGTPPLDGGTPPVDSGTPPLDGGSQAKICSGLEGFVTSAPPGLVPASMAPNALGAAAMSVNVLNTVTGQLYPNCNAAGVQSNSCPMNDMASGLRPGTWYAIDCTDSGGLDSTGTPIGYTNCLGPNSGMYMFDVVQAAVNASFGTAAVPTELADRRFFFKQWLLAFMKYVQSAGTPTATLAQIDANVVDPNDLYFDNYGGAGSGWETASYVDTLSVNSNDQPPTVVTLDVALLPSVYGNFIFSRYNMRGETLLYNALKNKPTDQPGAEPLLLSNIVGSPVLQLYMSQMTGLTGAAAYACAINQDPTKCGGFTGPLDDTGQPLYAPYANAFGASILSIPSFGATTENQSSGITVDWKDYQLIESAMVTLPLLPSPFAYTGTIPAGTPTAQALLPFLQGADIGFPVTIDGSRDKFYNTLNFDFSGESVNGNVDYEMVAATGTDGGVGAPAMVVRAFETQNYLGQVFACMESSPTVAGAYDVLGVRMYDNGSTIMQWIADHTYNQDGASNGAPADCGVQVKYSVYGNYPDYITFGVAPGLPIGGVRFGLNSGFGGSVITDATVFDPNIVASLAQANANLQAQRRCRRCASGRRGHQRRVRGGPPRA